VRIYKKDGCWEKPQYVPADALVRYWCSDDARYLELMKSELFQACKEGLVEHRLKVHKLNYPVEVSFAEGNLYIQLESFDHWVAGTKAESHVSITEEEATINKSEIDGHWDSEPPLQPMDYDNSWIDEAVARAEAEKKAKAAEVEEVRLKEDVSDDSSGSVTPQKYEYIIGTLDACFMGKFKEKKFKTDRELREFINDIYGNLNGISMSSLEKVISKSRGRLKRDHDAKENEEQILKKYHM
jgi:hypothetical protein